MNFFGNIWYSLLPNFCKSGLHDLKILEMLLLYEFYIQKDGCFAFQVKCTGFAIWEGQNQHPT